MKTIFKNLFMAGLVLTMLTGFNSCTKEQTGTEEDAYTNILKNISDENEFFTGRNSQCTSLSSTVLSEEEMKILVEIKEEEKLAHDVYVYLYQEWGSKIFYNISLSESRHMESVVLLLKYYGSADTLIADAGVFSTDKLQTLYNDLINAGSVSLADAYKTGAYIEEMDIKDITGVLQVVTESNIVNVFENLLQGSRNHLRAFNRQLTNLGITYTTTFISEEEFDAIVSSPLENWNHAAMNRHMRHGR
jgi:hypothetical protein